LAAHGELCRELLATVVSAWRALVLAAQRKATALVLPEARVTGVAPHRQLNTALHLIAVCQIRDPSPGQAYYQRKLAQAKTPEEARRSLKRHLANVVHAHLVADHQRRIPAS
jgi:hypothetical protein